MTVRKIDPETGDIVTSGTQFITGVDEIAQTVKTRLGLFLGEYFRDITEGTPWWESILGKEGTLSSKEAVLKNRILRTEGVTGLTSFSTEFDLATRQYTVKAGVLTIYGEAELILGNEPTTQTESVGELYDTLEIFDLIEFHDGAA